MFQFGPAGVTQVGLNVREAHGIEAHITGHGSIELFGDGEKGDGLGHRAEFQGGASLRVEVEETNATRLNKISNDSER